jgi:hypothetical protein
MKLLDGSTATKKHLLENAKDDEYYYGYLGRVAFSSTIIKTLLNSPKSFYYYRKYGDQQESAALSLGRIIHVMAIEPEVFEEQYELVEVKSKNTNKFKEARLNSQKACITLTEYEQANRIVDALMKNEAYTGRLRNSRGEVPAIGEIGGYPFRAKADILKEPYMYDLKTTTDLRSFPYAAKKYGYDIQAYIYTTLFNIDSKDFEFIAIDKSSLDIGIYSITSEFVESGKEKVEHALDTYTNMFAGKSDSECQQEINNYYIQGTLDA